MKKRSVPIGKRLEDDQKAAVSLYKSAKMETEKYLEKKLARKVKVVGGWSIKLLPFLVAGLPDRLCLMPGGVAIFAEVKGTGKPLRKLQKITIQKITNLGFDVRVIDCSADIETLIKPFEDEK